MDINETARRVLERRGIDLGALPPPEPVDIAATLIANATAALVLHLPALFLNALADHPQVRDWIGQLLANRSGAGSLLLLGPTGTGKTHQAVGALRECVIRSAKARRPLSWQFTTHPNLNAALRPAVDDGHLMAYDAAERTDLLVLDDLGAGKATDWTAETLYRLIDARWSNQRPHAHLVRDHRTRTVRRSTVLRRLPEVHVQRPGDPVRHVHRRRHPARVLRTRPLRQPVAHCLEGSVVGRLAAGNRRRRAEGDRRMSSQRDRFMMATKAHHGFAGDVSRAKPSLVVITGEDWIGEWVTSSVGLIHVHFPKATTRGR